MNTLFTGGTAANKEAKRLSQFCRKQLTNLYNAGLSPNEALLGLITVEIVPLHKFGPLTQECAHAILFLETKKRIYEAEVSRYVH